MIDMPLGPLAAFLAFHVPCSLDRLARNAVVSLPVFVFLVCVYLRFDDGLSRSLNALIHLCLHVVFLLPVVLAARSMGLSRFYFQTVRSMRRFLVARFTLRKYFT